VCGVWCVWCVVCGVWCVCVCVCVHVCGESNIDPLSESAQCCHSSSCATERPAGEPKTCDVSDKIAHYIDRGFDSDSQALEIRFLGEQAAGMAILPFSIGYILGSSRSMAAVVLLEALMHAGLSADNFEEVGPANKKFSQCLATLRRIRVTYAPVSDTTDLVIRTAGGRLCFHDASLWAGFWAQSV